MNMRKAVLTLLLAFAVLVGSLAFLPGLSRTNAAAPAPNWVYDDFAKCKDAASLNGRVCSSAYFAHSEVSYWLEIVFNVFGPMFGVTTLSKDPEYIRAMAQRSFVGQASKVIATAFTMPPADTQLWLADTGATLGFLPKKAYAQGVGFSGLAPLLPIWKGFRNLSYGLLAFIMIIIGFMVMFRKKIDPKTVVTVQNAIPRIIITLLLITFSYAIVGLMIDLMYFLILLAVIMFKSTGALPDPNQTIQTIWGLKTPEALYTTGGLFPNFLNIEANPYKIFFGWQVDPGLASAGMTLVAAIAALAGFAITGGPVGAAVGGGIGLALPLVHLLFALAVLFVFIRLVFFFIGSYIQIILSLIFGPIQILFEAVPGSSAFSSWFKNLLSNIVVFPIGAIIFMLSAVFMKLSSDTASAAIWAPPYVGILNNVVSITSAISLGLLFFIPTIGAQVKEAFKAKPFIQAGPEGVVGAVSHPTLLAWQIGQFFISHRQMGQIASAVKAGGGSSGGGKEEHH